MVKTTLLKNYRLDNPFDAWRAAARDAKLAWDAWRLAADARHRGDAYVRYCASLDREERAAAVLAITVTTDAT
jgi:hypothetical protein